MLTKREREHYCSKQIIQYRSSQQAVTKAQLSPKDVENTIEENNKPCCSRKASRLEEIRKYCERTLSGEFTNDDNQASDQNKQVRDDNIDPPKLAERQIMQKVTEEPELPTMPEQKKKQEPAMKALNKKVKKMKKNKKTTIRS